MKSKLATQLQNTILVLKQRQGASLAQIRKRLKINTGDDVQSKRLSHTLNSLVQKGKVEKQRNGVYKLARGAAAEEDQNVVPSRRRRSFPHGPCKTHRRYHKLRSSRGHHHRRRRRRHSRRRHSRRRRRHHRRRHSRRRRALPDGRRKRHRRYRKLRK